MPPNKRPPSRSDAISCSCRSGDAWRTICGFTTDSPRRWPRIRREPSLGCSPSKASPLPVCRTSRGCNVGGAAPKSVRGTICQKRVSEPRNCRTSSDSFSIEGSISSVKLIQKNPSGVSPEPLREVSFPNKEFTADLGLKERVSSAKYAVSTRLLIASGKLWEISTAADTIPKIRTRDAARTLTMRSTAPSAPEIRSRA